MAEVGLTQVIVVVGFLAVLIAVQIVLRRHVTGIGNRLGRGREIRVVSGHLATLTQGLGAACRPCAAAWDGGSSEGVAC